MSGKFTTFLLINANFHGLMEHNGIIVIRHIVEEKKGGGLMSTSAIIIVGVLALICFFCVKAGIKDTREEVKLISASNNGVNVEYLGGAS